MEPGSTEASTIAATANALAATFAALSDTQPKPVPHYADVPELEQLSERIRSLFDEIDFAPYSEGQLRLARHALRLCLADIDGELHRRFRSIPRPGTAQPKSAEWLRGPTYGT